MENKHFLTNTEIEKDIITALKNPPKESETSNHKSAIVVIVIAILLIVIEFIYPIFILYFFLALIPFIALYSIFEHVRLKNRVKNITINNYDITMETVHSITEEHSRRETGGSIRHRRTEQVNNYIVRFENGKIAKVPLTSYETKTNRKKLANAFYEKVPIADTQVESTNVSASKILSNFENLTFIKSPFRQKINLH